MKIYENLTLITYDYTQALFFLKKYKGKKINIFYSKKTILWQGPRLVKKIETKLKNKTNFIAEAKENIGLALALIHLDLEYLSISKELNKKLYEKIISVAKKKNTKIVVSEKFKKLSIN